MIKQLVILSLLLTLMVTSAYARDYPDLPLYYVFDPSTHHNERITDYSFYELDAMFHNPQFRKWTDVPQACASMQILFGRVSDVCAFVVPRGVFVPVTIRAYVPPPLPPPVLVSRHIILVDPLFPPWSPTYQPYW